MKKNIKKRSVQVNRVNLSPRPLPVQEHGLLVLAPVMICALLLIGLTAASNLRNRVFQNPVTLWADASSKSATKRRTHENYGQALSTAGFYKEALEQFKTVLALKDDKSVPMRDLYREIGVVYFRIGQIDESIKAWQTGLQHEPYDPSLLNNLSVAFIRQQRFDDAERTIRQALVRAPNMPQALNSLGEILMVKEKYEEALNCFLKAIQVSPDSPTRYWNAALAFEKTGRYDRAIEYATRYAGMEMIPDQRRRAAEYIQHLRGRYFK
jgi:tetratricopeptide (TPR) repeat protein